MQNAAPSRPIAVHFHTNKPHWERPPSSFVVSAGWATDSAQRLEQRTSLDRFTRAPWNFDASFKFDWLASQLDDTGGRTPERLHLLADTDILVQCSAEEVAERFSQMRARMVIGGERRWFPLPRNARDPFGPSANLSVRSARLEPSRSLARLPATANAPTAAAASRCLRSGTRGSSLGTLGSSTPTPA